MNSNSSPLARLITSWWSSVSAYVPAPGSAAPVPPRGTSRDRSVMVVQPTLIFASPRSPPAATISASAGQAVQDPRSRVALASGAACRGVGRTGNAVPVARAQGVDRVDRAVSSRRRPGGWRRRLDRIAQAQARSSGPRPRTGHHCDRRCPIVSLVAARRRSSIKSTAAPIESRSAACCSAGGSAKRSLLTTTEIARGQRTRLPMTILIADVPSIGIAPDLRLHPVEALEVATRGDRRGVRAAARRACASLICDLVIASRAPMKSAGAASSSFTPPSTRSRPGRSPTDVSPSASRPVAGIVEDRAVEDRFSRGRSCRRGTARARRL